MEVFNPNEPGIPGQLFGLPANETAADVVVLAVPWDVTASYGAGSVKGPEAILTASCQIDHSLPGIDRPWTLSSYLVEQPDIKEKSLALRPKADQYIRSVEHGQVDVAMRDRINQSCHELEDLVFTKSEAYLNQGKVVGCLGGDHSTPLGLIHALSQQHDAFGILQIDAHMDLRNAYEGLEHSHASIMRNALCHQSIERLVQVGVRDYCEEETTFASSQGGRVITHYDRTLKNLAFQGQNWSMATGVIVDSLPDEVYVSFDIDGLDPSHCPNTGTPVPGGLSYDQAIYLLEEVVRSGRSIIGFDLSEVCPGNNQGDANVGARILYHLCVLSGISQGKLKFTD